MEAPPPMDVTMDPAEAPAAADVTMMASDDVTMAPAEAPARRGRPKVPLVCAGCKREFHSSDAKYNHVRRGKCIPV